MYRTGTTSHVKEYIVQNMTRHAPHWQQRKFLKLRKFCCFPHHFSDYFYYRCLLFIFLFILALRSGKFLDLLSALVTFLEWIKSLGIAKTTPRGCRSGASRQRPIPCVMGYGRYSHKGNYAVDSNSALTFKSQVISSCST